MTQDQLREEIIQHLTEWFRDLGVETAQIENSADAIMAKVEEYRQADQELLDKYARVIAAVYDGVRVAEAEKEQGL